MIADFQYKMATLMDAAVVISLVNITLLSALLAIYARIYRNTRAAFTVGLIFFAGLLILHNMIAAYAYFAMAPLYSEALLPYLFGIHIAELAGISALFRVTI